MKRIQSRAAWHCGVWMLFSLVVHLGWVLFWPVVEPVIPAAQPANAAPLALAFAMPGVSRTLAVETPELSATRLEPAPEVARPAPAPATPAPESVAESVTPARVQPQLQSQSKPAATMARKAETVPLDPRPAAAAAQPRVPGAAIASAVPAADPPAPVVTQSPRYARPPEKPSYPSMARRRGWQGEVWLQIDVSPGGESGEPVLLRSSGFEVLDKAALVVARQWRFIPEVRDGRPVATRVQVPVQFALR